MPAALLSWLPLLLESETFPEISREIFPLALWTEPNTWSTMAAKRRLQRGSPSLLPSGDEPEGKGDGLSIPQHLCNLDPGEWVESSRLANKGFLATEIECVRTESWETTQYRPVANRSSLGRTRVSREMRKSERSVRGWSMAVCSSLPVRLSSASLHIPSTQQCLHKSRCLISVYGCWDQNGTQMSLRCWENHN